MLRIVRGAGSVHEAVWEMKFVCVCVLAGVGVGYGGVVTVMFTHDPTSGLHFVRRLVTGGGIQSGDAIHATHAVSGADCRARSSLLLVVAAAPGPDRLIVFVPSGTENASQLWMVIGDDTFLCGIVLLLSAAKKGVLISFGHPLSAMSCWTEM